MCTYVFLTVALLSGYTMTRHVYIQAPKNQVSTEILCIECQMNTWYAQYFKFTDEKISSSPIFVVILVQKCNCFLPLRVHCCKQSISVTEKSQKSDYFTAKTRRGGDQELHWRTLFTIYSSASLLWGKGRTTACSWAMAASSLRNSQKITAQ